MSNDTGIEQRRILHSHHQCGWDGLVQRLHLMMIRRMKLRVDCEDGTYWVGK